MTQPEPADLVLDCPQGSLTLRRYPAWSQRNRRAWDAADEYVLGHLADVGAAPRRTIVALGGQGALTVALAGDGEVIGLLDSYVDELATVDNLAANGRGATLVGPLDDTGGADLLVVKVPKSIALLEDTLARLVPALAPGTPVVGAGMARHVHTSTVETFERFVGPTTTTPARKKARLLLSSVSEAPRRASGWPRTVDAGPGRRLVNHAGVFSAERLDRGTSLLLDHLPEFADDSAVLDLGCGNGIVGVAIAERAPSARVTFVDESRLAMASAVATAEANLGTGRVAEDVAAGRLRFELGDGLSRWASGGMIDEGTLDLVVVNPPFHDDHAVGDAVAWQMFTQAHGALRRGGQLLVVGNRHLGYHAKLRRIFRNGETVASDPRFVVLSSVR